jgi:cytochrome c-type biogenesis protein CcmE
MTADSKKYLKFGGATALILVSLAYLAYTGAKQSSSYYVTIRELEGMGDGAYSKRLRVAGNVQPGSIKRHGPKVDFVLTENDRVLAVAYSGSEPPPDTFKDNAQALAEGRFSRDGVFHASALQAKCASKYAPRDAVNPAPGASPAAGARNVTEMRTEAPPVHSN